MDAKDHRLAHDRTVRKLISLWKGILGKRSDDAFIGEFDNHKKIGDPNEVLSDGLIEFLWRGVKKGRFSDCNFLESTDLMNDQVPLSLVENVCFA